MIVCNYDNLDLSTHPVVLKFCNNTAACACVNARRKHSLIGRRLAQFFIGILIGTQIGAQVEWLSSHLNFIADDILRLKEKNENGDYDCANLKKVLPNTCALPSIPAVKFPSWDYLGDSARRKLSRSFDCPGAQTKDTRTVHFLEFVERYGISNWYLTNDVATTNDIMLRYIIYLLEAFTIKSIFIVVGTITGYMSSVNDHYKGQGLICPWDYKSDSQAALLLRSQSRFEGKHDRREPLRDKVLAQMKVSGT